MRTLQICIFIIGLAAFLDALFFIGREWGDTLWRVGMAAMITDFVLLQLWPQPHQSPRKTI